MLIGALAMAAFLVARSLLIRSGRNSTTSGFLAGLLVAAAAVTTFAASFALHFGQKASPINVEATPNVKIVGVPIHSRRLFISHRDLIRLAPVRDAPAIGYIESVNGINADQSAGRLRFPIGTMILVAGWAGEPAQIPGAALMLIIDSKRRINATNFYDKRRVDVAEHFGTRAMEYSGFEGAPILTANLSKGTHQIEVGVVSADRRHYYLVRQIRAVELY